MNHVPSLTVVYWAEQTGPTSIDELAGIKEFQQDLDKEYLAVVHGRPGDLGGLYQLAVSFVTNITLSDVASFIAAGIAYDLLKSGSKQFLLRPFILAYERLRERNKQHRIDIEELRLEFQDSIVAIDSTFENAIPSQIGPLLLTLAKSYPILTLASGETPFEIRIPVLEDTSPESLGRFRAVLEVDEMVAKRKPADYFGFWGLWYDFSRQYRVFDIQRQVLLDQPFLSRQRYWTLSEEKWRKSRSE